MNEGMLKDRHKSGSPIAQLRLAPEWGLLSFKDLESFIKQNRHLPNMPTADAVKANGIDVSEINVALVQKVEELTLYVLQLQKEIEELKK